VRNIQEAKKGNMKTTMVFLTIEDGRAKWMHVGDSRLYHFHCGQLLTQTTDHSVSQMAVLMGEITPQQIRFHEDRNRVLRALGSESARPEISQTVMLTGGEDVFLLCTDGFWEYVYEEEMEALLRRSATPEQWLEEMKQILLTRIPQDNDNFTAAAVFC
jgi:serine/threonine protein phosphatase PrpC